MRTVSCDECAAVCQRRRRNDQIRILVGVTALAGLNPEIGSAIEDLIGNGVYDGMAAELFEVCALLGCALFSKSSDHLVPRDCGNCELVMLPKIGGGLGNDVVVSLLENFVQDIRIEEGGLLGSD